MIEQDGRSQGFLTSLKDFVGWGCPLDLCKPAGLGRGDQGVQWLEELISLRDESPLKIKHDKELI